MHDALLIILRRVSFRFISFRLNCLKEVKSQEEKFSFHGYPKYSLEEVPPHLAVTKEEMDIVRSVKGLFQSAIDPTRYLDVLTIELIVKPFGEIVARHNGQNPTNEIILKRR